MLDQIGMNPIESVVRLRIDSTEVKHIDDARKQYNEIFQEEYDSIGRPPLTSKLLNDLQALALQKQSLINNNRTYTPQVKYLEGWK